MRRPSVGAAARCARSRAGQCADQGDSRRTATVQPPPGVDRESFYTAVSGLDQSYWVIGSTIGALVGGALPFDSRGIDFALTALFIVLLVEQIRSVKKAAPYLVATVATGAALFLVGPVNFLVVAILASIIGILPFRKALS